MPPSCLCLFFVRNKNFFNKEILAGQNVFVEAAAIGAVTLVLNYVEYSITTAG